MTDKKELKACSSDPSRPFAHLEPIVEALIGAGNVPVYAGWFSMDQDGWHCILEKPIDFDYLERKFVFPETISLSRGDGAILDTRTWVEIRGGKGNDEIV